MKYIHPKQKTHDQFVEEVYELTSGEYEVIGQYKNARTKIEIKHKDCGRILNMNPHNFLASGTRCKYCAIEQAKEASRKDQEEVKKDLFNAIGDEYEILGQYVNSKTKVLVKHKTCGFEWETIINSVIYNGNKCPCCSKKRVTKTQENFEEEIKLLTNSEYKVVGKYKNAKTLIAMEHTKCGTRWLVKPYNFLNGSRCPECSAKQPKQHDIFVQEVYAIFKDEYNIVDKYSNSTTKITVKHNKCGFEYKTLPTSLLRGCGCPKCKQSKGEKKIEETLQKYNIRYERQYRIDNCRNTNPLPFDFAVLNDKKEILFLIEYQGVQHYEIVDYFGGEEEFKTRKKNDSIKEDYCKENDIPLLCISYNEYELIPVIIGTRILG